MRAVNLLLVCLLLAGCNSSGPTSGNTPEEMFQYVIMNPIPASVKNLQGVGDTWQGYSLYLRFTAAMHDIDAVIAEGFQPVEWKSISSWFVLRPGYDKFSPAWHPEAIAKRECYEMDNVSNDWTGSGSHYMVIDRGTGTVYFYGVGA